MEAIHAERIEEVEREEAERPPVARTANVRKMFQYSAFVDVGDGAEDCEHKRDGQCKDIEHFHAWCRLPNPYQHNDIRDKGLAAKARRIRLLRDPNSDQSVILDESLMGIEDPAFLGMIVDEMLAREWADDYLQSERDIQEQEEFEHIAQDREEYNRLKVTQAELPEDEQTQEYTELVAHLAAFVKALQKRLLEVQEPKRAELMARSPEEIVALVRAKRVEEQADQEFSQVYNAWMWFVGTYNVEKHPTLGRPYQSKWAEIGVADKGAAGTMFGESPEVVDALKATFNQLQISLQQGSSGN